jgi:ATP-dependent RNA helicase RhlE
MIDTILHQPETIKVSSGVSSSEHIEQDVVKVAQGEDKYKVLLNMLNDEDFERVLLFDETKHRVNRLCQKLVKSGVPAEAIHGNKSQNARQNALDQFKKGRVKVLVATDVAARGIDVDDVTHVINYQIPQTMDSYIHRVGRTGRAGKAGKAFTFVD